MIYLDNAATTLYKPKSVINAVSEWMTKSANPGRGGHGAALSASEKVYECRELAAKLFNIEKPENIVFTCNTTMALNIAINGLLTKSSHVVISGTEHNSVYRPITNIGCRFSVAKADSDGFVSAKSVKSAVRPDTSLIVVTHASNVVGTINPITEIGKLAKSLNIPFLVDAAQTAGVLDIDVGRDNISMLAFAGHKMLFGPTGTGGLYLSPEITLKPIIFGGTGSVSESAYQPDFMPDRFESGTLNTVGIAGLSEGIKFVIKNSVDEIHRYENELIKKLTENLKSINGVKLFGGTDKVGITAFSLSGLDSVNVCNMLNESGIAARGGLHCALLAHRSLGTENGGLARLSVSCFNTIADINEASNAVWKIAKVSKSQ